MQLVDRAVVGPTVAEARDHRRLRVLPRSDCDACCCGSNRVAAVCRDSKPRRYRAALGKCQANAGAAVLDAGDGGGIHAPKSRTIVGHRIECREEHGIGDIGSETLQAQLAGLEENLRCAHDGVAVVGNAHGSKRRRTRPRRGARRRDFSAVRRWDRSAPSCAGRRPRVPRRKAELRLQRRSRAVQEPTRSPSRPDRHR